MIRYIVGLVGVIGGVLAVGWLGLRTKPKRLPGYPEPTPEVDKFDLPDDLPAPVARFFKNAIGDRVPVIESAVLTGSVALRTFGFRFPGRFRIVHLAGQGYRHYIEVTFFGFPVMKVNEKYLDGQARLELPFSVVEMDRRRCRDDQVGRSAGFQQAAQR